MSGLKSSLESADIPTKDADVSAAAEERAVDSASSFVSTLTSVGAAALVFSVGLVSNAADFDKVARTLLVVAWALFSLSVLCGLLAQAAIPMHLHHGRSIFDSGFFEKPAQAQQVSFALAVLFIAVVLTRNLYMADDTSELAVKSATMALERARQCIVLQSVDRVEKIELIGDGNAADLLRQTWHLQFGGATKSNGLDAFIQAGNGNVDTFPAVPLAKSCVPKPR